jgi:hypothetical protein
MLAVAVWAGSAIGCDPLAWLWMAWVAVWTTPLTALVTGEDGACVVWLVAGAVLAAAAGALDAGALDADVLEGAEAPLLLAVA